MSPCRYKVQIVKKARKVIERLPKNLKERVVAEIDGLEEEPRPAGCVKLRGYDNLYRIRVGDWRIAYAIEDDVLVVLILKVAPRSRIYRDI